jgi:hypothetical protein
MGLVESHPISFNSPHAKFCSGQQNPDPLAAFLLGGRLLEFGTLFGHNCTLYRTDLKTNAAVDAGRKINPVPIGSFRIFSWPFMDTGYRASIDAIRNAFANIGHYRMSHCVFLPLIF